MSDELKRLEPNLGTDLALSGDAETNSTRLVQGQYQCDALHLKVCQTSVEQREREQYRFSN